MYFTRIQLRLARCKRSANICRLNEWEALRLQNQQTASWKKDLTWQKTGCRCYSCLLLHPQNKSKKAEQKESFVLQLTAPTMQATSSFTKAPSRCAGRPQVWARWIQMWKQSERQTSSWENRLSTIKRVHWVFRVHYPTSFRKDDGTLNTGSQAAAASATVRAGMDPSLRTRQWTCSPLRLASSIVSCFPSETVRKAIQSHLSQHSPPTLLPYLFLWEGGGWLSVLPFKSVCCTIWAGTQVSFSGVTE